MGASPVVRVLTRSGGTPPEKRSPSDVGAEIAHASSEPSTPAAARLLCPPSADAREYASPWARRPCHELRASATLRSAPHPALSPEYRGEGSRNRLFQQFVD